MEGFFQGSGLPRLISLAPGALILAFKGVRARVTLPRLAVGCFLFPSGFFHPSEEVFRSLAFLELPRGGSRSRPMGPWVCL